MGVQDDPNVWPSTTFREDLDGVSGPVLTFTAVLGSEPMDEVRALLTKKKLLLVNKI